ncbi:DUF4198 domain-containing protein [Pedobacter nanyangensis]|uniref:DUF4198 domain-containing protein n=1 Tax=Pedobacter nanyangensis TaxID=1562389 RepID=UPI000DE50720|nr:hypothetical protein [Pedobacter nanyangensis]
MKKILTLFLFVAMAATSYGHALWIETNTNGQKGVAQKVKVFFGEYGTKEIDSAAKWYSNLKEFKLVLTSPNGSKQALKTKAGVFHYEADFTPTQDGQYTLSIVHQVKDLYENAKIDYYALANVFVGSAKLADQLGNDVTLSIAPAQTSFVTGQESAHAVKLNQSAFKNQKLTVVGPEKKSETINTNSNGLLNFTPKQKGTYFLEAFYEEKKSGSQAGKNYDKIWHVATYTRQAL